MWRYTAVILALLYKCPASIIVKKKNVEWLKQMTNKKFQLAAEPGWNK